MKPCTFPLEFHPLLLFQPYASYTDVSYFKAKAEPYLLWV